jgi:DNA-binding GntR family transcriptional regulator
MTVSDAVVRPIETRSVVGQVTAELRRSILAGTLAPGSEFSLREIAAMLNVSFIPVREALRSLEGEGLVVTRPGRSAIVSPLDRADLDGIYRLRHQLEPEIAGRACTLLSAAELDQLEAQATEFGRPEVGIDAIYEAHHAFHMALLAPAMTEWDTRVLTTLWRAAERYIRIGFGRLDPDPAEHNRREHSHRHLIDIYRDQDVDAVAAAMHEHLERNEITALRALDLAPSD